MPNNTDNNNYVATAMNTGSIQLFMLAPVFLTGAAMKVLSKINIPNRGFYKALRLIKPLTEEELNIVQTNFPITSKTLAIISNVALGLDIGTGVAMAARATNLQANLGNEKVANQDINFSWITSATGLISPITNVTSNIINRSLLYTVPENQLNNGQDIPSQEINTIEVPTVEISDLSTAEQLLSGCTVDIQIEINPKSNKLVQTNSSKNNIQITRF